MMQYINSIEDKIMSSIQLPRMMAAIAENKGLIYLAIFLAIVCYGYEIFGFSLRIDSDYYAQTSEPNLGWVSQGRWVMYLLNCYLLPDVVMPVIPPLIAVIGISAGSLFFVASMSGERSIASYLALALLVSSPVFYFANYFTTLGYGVGIGFMFAGLANYTLFRQGFSKWLLALALYILAIGVYQALLPVIAVMFGLALLDHFLDKQSDIKFFFTKAVSFVVAIGLAYVVYSIINNAFITHYELSSNDAYLSNFNQVQWNLAFFVTSFEASWQIILDYYLGGSPIYLYDLTAMEKLFHLVVILNVFRIAYVAKGIFSRLIGLLLLLAVLLAPIAMLLMNNGLMPPRTMIAVPVVVAGLVYMAAKCPFNFIKVIVLLLVIACVFKYTVVLNRYSFANTTQWEADKIYSTLLLNDLYRQWDALPVKSIHASYPIDIIGVHFERETAMMVNREVVGASFYQWGAGDLSRIIAVFQAMGIHDYTAPSNEQQINMIPAVMQMPSWPRIGSVQVIDGVIVIKLDEYNWHQILRICSNAWERDECKLAKEKLSP